MSATPRAGRNRAPWLAELAPEPLGPRLDEVRPTPPGAGGPRPGGTAGRPTPRRGMRLGALLALGLLLAASDAAAMRRFAVVVGANAGDAGELQLRYAEDDAERIARILRDVGGFEAADVLLLNGVDAEQVRRGLIGVNARIREAGGDALLFVYFSGHGDVDSLHLSRTRLDTRELHDLLAGSPARARVLVIDACRSGGITRVKGGSPGPAFRIDFESRTEGLAILTSSAAGEDSQESDRYGASIFTHYLASALLGAGDRDVDGRVTLGEAFSYASERTLVATAQTLAGPQHPTYRFELGGRDDLVLTRPADSGRRTGLVAFPGGGSYLVHQGGPEGPVVAEVTSPASSRLALRPGAYFVTRRAPDHLLQGELRVAEAATTEVRLASLRRLDYAEVVRKGGTDRAATASVFAHGSLRGELLGLGAAPGALLGGRLDLPFLTLEARFSLAQGSADSARLTIDTRELGLGVAALRAFDLGGVTLAGGLEAGVVFLDQFFHERQTPDRSSTGLVVGPLAAAELPLAGPLHLRGDAALLTYFLPGDGGDTLTPVTWRFGAGLGRYF